MRVLELRASSWWGGCTTYCHGLFVRWGETSNQLPRNGLYLRCEMSSRIWSGMMVLVYSYEVVLEYVIEQTKKLV